MQKQQRRQQRQRRREGTPPQNISTSRPRIFETTEALTLMNPPQTSRKSHCLSRLRTPYTRHLSSRKSPSSATCCQDYGVPHALRASHPVSFNTAEPLALRSPPPKVTQVILSLPTLRNPAHYGGPLHTSRKSPCLRHSCPVVERDGVASLGKKHARDHEHHHREVREIVRYRSIELL